MELKLRELINESRKIRENRGHEFDSKGIHFKNSELTSVRLNEIENKDNFESKRKSHIKLNEMVLEFEREIASVDKFSDKKEIKKRSKSVHVYIDEKIETFLNEEKKRSHSWWGLRKNVGLGGLIQKFIEDYIKIKKREEFQVQKIRKIISEFRMELVSYKKKSTDPDLYLEAEKHNQKMRTLSSEMIVYISAMGFDEITLEKYLGVDYKFIDLIIRWKI